ncbi:MAG: 30S ribosomal protein S1 [Desulfobacteraceae bacterium 4484_190.3]|nr:MAG: 30S ribosomal protein S1 [Desulfobacteraceae bacterium 4484_190.3]
MVNEDNINVEKEKHIQSMDGDVSLENEGEGEKTHQSEETLSFVDLYEKSLQDVSYGEILMGKVVQIRSDVVMVDVGYKTEGKVSASELQDDDGNITVSVGDEIEVVVDRKEEEDLILSRNKAVTVKVWNDLKTACDTNCTIRGNIIERVKGGFSVDIGIPAFLPGSQVDIHPVKDYDKYLGQELDFQVLKYDKKRNNVVLSRKTVLEHERQEEKEKTLSSIEEGSIVEGIVKNITDYGLFIDLGGIDGLLHVTDISWGRIKHPSESFSRGDKLTVKILAFDREKERVSLGLKQLTDNPWDNIADRYSVGTIVEGKVVNIMDYGAFIELEPGVEGLVHISEMFWTKKMKHPSKILSIGDVIAIKILDINPETKRISLGLKQTTQNPWVNLKEKYPTGSIVKGSVRNITDFGIFVGIEDEIDGLIHISDISWRKRVKHPAELYKKGDEIEAVVLNVDVENEKFSLGIKQLEKDPWEELSVKYNVGSTISGRVTNVTDFGVFVEVEEGIEGLVHVSELSQDRINSAKELYVIDDTVTAIIKNIDSKSRKLGLSIKDYETNSEKSSLNHYIGNNEKVSSNLGKALADLKLDDL